MKIQIKRSNQLVDGEAKAPEEDMLDYGELAVNFNEADPAIFIKASDGAGSSSIVRLAGANVDPPPLPITFTAIITDTGADGNLVGNILTAEAQNINGGVNPVESAYRWYINGIPDSTSKTRTIQPSDIGGTLTCDITVSENGTGDNPVTQRATYAKTPAPAGSISTPRVLTPPDGAGIGGDITYTPKTSAITGVVDVPGGWNAVTPPEVNGWWSVTYGLDKFVAVAGSGTNRVMYSTDGITWTSASAAEENFWYSVTYGNGKFVAVSTSGTNRVMYSTDGITWTSALAAEANNWLSVTYGGGKFVAISTTGTNLVMYSTDGINWNPASVPEANQWYSVTYGDGKFVAVAGSGTNRVMYSTDGISWTAASAAEANRWRAVTYGNGKFVAVSEDGTNRVMYSTDAINWTAAAATEANYWYGITYGNGRFVAVALDGTNRVMHSTDAINWTPVAAAAASEWQAVTYGAGKFVAVAANGANERIMWSETGTDSSTELTLTNSNTYNNADGSVMPAPISQTFLAGQTVSGVSATGTYGTDSSAFETLLWAGNSGNQTLTTTVDLSERSLFWTKERSLPRQHFLYTPGVFDDLSFALSSDTDSPGQLPGAGLTDIVSVDSTSITLGNTGSNYASSTYVGWGFRAAPGFLDIVTWTGDAIVDGPSDPIRKINHSLGTVPGMIITKKVDSNGSWMVYHKELYPSDNTMLYLNLSNGADIDNFADYYSSHFAGYTATTTDFGIGGASAINENGKNFIAYVFADTPGKIKCDEYTGVSGSQTIECGFKPGWVLLKSKNDATGWFVADSERTDGGYNSFLSPNSNGPEDTSNKWIALTNTGFTVSSILNSNGTEYIYVAIAENVVAGEFGPTGTLTANADDNGPTITLSDVTGTWEAGMEIVNDTEITEFAPGADVVEFTSTTPAGTGITTYGNATWQVDTDANFSSPMTATKAITAGSTQELLPSERGAIVLVGDTTYNIRVKYDAADPSGVQSAYSDVNQFKTAGPQNGYNPVELPGKSPEYLAYGNNRFVSLPYSAGESNLSADKDDLNNWEEGFAFPFDMQDLIYSDNLQTFLATGMSPSSPGTAYISSDGKTFTEVTLTTQSGSSRQLRGVYGDQFVLTASSSPYTFTSPNGITWQEHNNTVNNPNNFTYSPVLRLAYGQPSTGLYAGQNLYVGVQYGGSVDPNAAVYTQDPTSQWSFSTAGTPTTAGCAAITYANGYFVAVAASPSYCLFHRWYDVEPCY